MPPAIDAVELAQPEFAVVRGGQAREMRVHRLSAPRHILGMQRQHGEQFVQRHHFRPGWQACKLARARRKEHAARGEVDVPHAVVRAGDGERVALPAFAQRLLGELARRDVVDRASPAHRFAVVIPRAHADHVQPAQLAVRHDPDHDVHARCLAGKMRRDRRFVVRPVLRIERDAVHDICAPRILHVG